MTTGTRKFPIFYSIYFPIFLELNRKLPKGARITVFNCATEYFKLFREYILRKKSLEGEITFVYYLGFGLFAVYEKN